MTKREQVKIAIRTIVKRIIEKPRKHDMPPFTIDEYAIEETNNILKEVEIRFPLKEESVVHGHELDGG